MISTGLQKFTLPPPYGHGSAIPSEPGYPLGPSASGNAALRKRGFLQVSTSAQARPGRRCAVSLIAEVPIKGAGQQDKVSHLAAFVVSSSCARIIKA